MYKLCLLLILLPGFYSSGQSTNFVDEKGTLYYPKTIEIKADSIIQKITIDVGEFTSDVQKIQCSFRCSDINDPFFIVRAFTGDPHFICNYPREPLQTDSVYTFTICMARRVGPLNKTMGFNFSNGKRVFFRLKGNTVKRDTTEE